MDYIIEYKIDSRINEINIKEVMQKVLLDPNYRKNLINKGRNHSKKFNWNHTVSQTMKVLNIIN